MSLSDLRVMVVEDHGFQRRMALRLLVEAGVGATSEAADGAEALELLRTLAHPPDVLLVDLDMPGMDGVEFIGHVAQHRLARAIALVSALDSAVLNTVQTMARAYGMRVLGGLEAGPDPRFRQQAQRHPALEPVVLHDHDPQVRQAHPASPAVRCHAP